MIPLWPELLFAVLIGFSCFSYGFAIGYSTGVKHTEERWRDAVGRAGHK